MSLKIYISQYSRWRRKAKKILALAYLLDNVPDRSLLVQAEELRWKLKSGVMPRQALTTLFAIAVEAIRRELGYRLFVEQLMGAIGLTQGRIVEMATGEGKTITAALPVILRGLYGKGCHVVTSNDYLAKRDSDLLHPVYQRIGLSTGCVHPALETDERREQYAKDKTYGTGTEMGFDFLRDRLLLGASVTSRTTKRSKTTNKMVQRNHYFALVDEADNLLIDDSRTPLIIGLEQESNEPMSALYSWCSNTAAGLTQGTDFAYEISRRSAWLTELGARKVTLLQKPYALDAFSFEQILHQVEKSLVAIHGMSIEKDYVVTSNEVAIVCESTGRTLAGRKWQDGLHQAVEVKERIPRTAPTQTAATITVQSYFRTYRFLAGMTGTGIQAKKEFRKYYKLGVTPIPTQREALRPRVFFDQVSKRHAIVDSVKELVLKGRAILIGTSSVASSQKMSEQLLSASIEHVFLNAIQHDCEAEIVRNAGQPRKVTVATNMAGRGTDIKLNPDVASAGGLHVIATEMNISKRIDRQLVGRAARQGDPGSFQYFLALDDKLMMQFRSPKWLLSIASTDRRGELPATWFNRFVRTQMRIERRNEKLRLKQFKQSQERMRQHQDTGFDLFLEVTDGN